jgi:hypothetical protein
MTIASDGLGVRGHKVNPNVYYVNRHCYIIPFPDRAQATKTSGKQGVFLVQRSTQYVYQVDHPGRRGKFLNTLDAVMERLSSTPSQTNG